MKVYFLSLTILCSCQLHTSDGWLSSTLPRTRLHLLSATVNGDEDVSEEPDTRRTYNLGIGKHKPYGDTDEDENDAIAPQNNEIPHIHWNVPQPAIKPPKAKPRAYVSSPKQPRVLSSSPKKTRRMLARDNESQRLRSALWDEQHFATDAAPEEKEDLPLDNNTPSGLLDDSAFRVSRPTHFYPDIDLSIPDSVYTDGEIDLVWDLLRWEAYEQAQREPLLVSFMYSTILNHPSLESSLAFLLANRLQSPAMMISTQLQSLILNALKHSPVFRKSLRADIMAVRDRDPACNYLPDVFLYFKGFHALQTHRVANCLWTNQKRTLALFLQSQVSQIFQIDIHPNATMGSGILVDHGTGVVIGSTVRSY
jgi:serine O-acetyltransferase